MKTILPYTIIYSDEKILAVDKASGISVGGDRWDESKERLDKLIERDLKIKKIYTVHRIDKETSGIVVFAKDNVAHKKLSIAFEKREVSKLYTAIVHGHPSWKETSCDLPLVPNGNKKHQTIIDKYKGKKSLTHFTCIHNAGRYSIIHAKPVTGRIHQIRVHLKAIGHPVVCDSLYGNDKPVFLSALKKHWKGDVHEEKPLLARLALHASEIILPEENMTFTSRLPRDMAALVNQLKKI